MKKKYVVKRDIYFIDYVWRVINTESKYVVDAFENKEEAKGCAKKLNKLNEG